jgi:hypothetical protein
MLRHNLALLKLRVSGRMYTPWHIAAENGRVGVLRVMTNYIKHPEASHILNTRIRSAACGVLQSPVCGQLCSLNRIGTCYHVQALDASNTDG